MQHKCKQFKAVKLNYISHKEQLHREIKSNFWFNSMCANSSQMSDNLPGALPQHSRIPELQKKGMRTLSIEKLLHRNALHEAHLYMNRIVFNKQYFGFFSIS